MWEQRRNRNINKRCQKKCYAMMQPVCPEYPPEPFARVVNDTRAASKKTSLTPRLCFELHSDPEVVFSGTSSRLKTATYQDILKLVSVLQRQDPLRIGRCAYCTEPADLALLDPLEDHISTLTGWSAWWTA